MTAETEIPSVGAAASGDRIAAGLPLLPDLAAIAESQLGLEESPRGSNGGPALEKFFEADDLFIDHRTDGYPWCACFVSWCVQRWMEEVQRVCSSAVQDFIAPRISRAFAFEGWARDNNLAIAHKSASRGDIVIFEFSHCGIVTGIDAAGKGFESVEGNTVPGTTEDQRLKAEGPASREGYVVARRERNIDQARCFIQLPSFSLQPSSLSLSSREVA